MQNLPDDDRAPAPSRRHLPRGVSWAIALAIVVLAVAAWQATGRTSSPQPSTATGTGPSTSSAPGANPLLRPGSNPTGKPLPTTSFERFDGSSGSFGDYTGRPLVVNFWASTCTPCLTEMPDLEAVHQEYADRVAFVGVDVQDARSSGQAMAAKTGVTYDLVRDPDGSLFTSLGGYGLPTTLLVRPDGTVARLAGPGAVTAEQLRSWIDQDLP